MAGRSIFNFIKKHAFSYIFGILFMIAASTIQTFFPKVLGHTIDLLKLKNFNPADVKFNILLILLIAAATFVFTYLWRNLVIGNSRKLECDLRENFYSHLQKMSAAFYSERKTGDLIAYGINDISAVRMAFGPTSALAINSLVICAASIYSMSVSINWRLTLMALLPIPFIVFFTVKAGFAIKKRFKKVQESFGTISGRIQENIYGIRVIKAYVQEESEIQNFEVLNRQMSDANLNLVKVSALLTPTIELCFSLSFVMTLIFGGSMVLHQVISLGDFVAFNTYLVTIMTPIISIGGVINNYQRGMASLGRLNDIFNIPPEITEPTHASKDAIQGTVEFRNLSFTYPGAQEKALDSINISLQKGHTLGVVGKTGAGKTTLASLLFRLYNVGDGQILIDGKDINRISLKTLRNSISLAPQDNFLFSTTVRDNIRFFKEIFSEDDVENAARQGCIYDHIEALDEGFGTVLGERGVNLSGGQKQRVSIARSLIKESPVLILDDTLSAVDTVTEGRILENLWKVRRGKTNIIIAHRLSAVKNADEIIVLDHGRIVERGTHSQLIERKGYYYDIYTEQTSKDENSLGS
ncbi:MAG TPA: ABC transporter ATP-binding protein [Clostridia bacterium]|nr:ABC transporter ATP-binding protein [Clostridia bacterium]